MTYEIVYSDNFIKQTKSFLKGKPHFQEKIDKALEILEENPFHPSLRLHKLKGKFQDLYSISLTMQYRIVIDFIIIDKRIILLSIGGHEIYG